MTSVTPKKAADAINANGQHLHTTDIDFLTGAATQQAVAQAPTNKAVATALAHLALAGHAVQKGCAGDFTVCKYGMARYCKDFAELQAFSRKLGVTK